MSDILLSITIGILKREYAAKGIQKDVLELVKEAAELLKKAREARDGKDSGSDTHSDNDT